MPRRGAGMTVVAPRPGTARPRRRRPPRAERRRRDRRAAPGRRPRRARRRDARRRCDAAVAAAPPPRPIAERLAAPGLHLIAEVKRRRRRPAGSPLPATTSSRARGPTRPAARRRSRSCASRTGSAARSTTCAPSARPSRVPGPGQGIRRRRAPAGAPPRGRRRPGAAARRPPPGAAPRAARRAALDLGLEPLVEAHDERELERALATSARLIGLNNRDLRTLDVDPERAGRLRELVPDDRLVIAESGVREPATVARWRALGLRRRARRRGADARRRSGRRGAAASWRPAPARPIRPTSRAGRS